LGYRALDHREVASRINDHGALRGIAPQKGGVLLKGRDRNNENVRFAHGRAALVKILIEIWLEPISKSFEEDDETGELHEAKEVLRIKLPADKNAALQLNPGEEPLH